MDVNEIKEILRILEEQEITEFELEQDGVKLRVARAARNSAPGAAVVPVSPVPVLPAGSAAVPPPAPAAGGNSGPAPSVPAPETATNGKEAVVKSPIVGTFYRSPDPNSPPFASVGDRVRVGQVLCIIEAMKLMNEIEAEVAGEVVKVHMESGQPVQYGDPLFTILPS